jgi:hypothetical protein
MAQTDASQPRRPTYLELVGVHAYRGINVSRAYVLAQHSRMSGPRGRHPCLLRPASRALDQAALEDQSAGALQQSASPARRRAGSTASRSAVRPPPPITAILSVTHGCGTRGSGYGSRRTPSVARGTASLWRPIRYAKPPSSGGQSPRAQTPSVRERDRGRRADESLAARSRDQTRPTGPRYPGPAGSPRVGLRSRPFT